MIMICAFLMIPRACFTIVCPSLRTDPTGAVFICSISPGPLKLTELMDPSNPNDNQEEREKQKELYDLFPMYPTGKLSSPSFPPYVFDGLEII